MIDLRRLKRGVQSHDALPHPFGFLCPDTDPEQMNTLSESGGIGHCAIEDRLRVQRVTARRKHVACAAESADVGEEIEMVESHMECLHPAH